MLKNLIVPLVLCDLDTRNFLVYCYLRFGWNAQPFYSSAPKLHFDNQNDGQRGQNQRPNVIRDPQPSGFSGTQTKWFDTAAFAIPAPYTYGNLGRNTLYGPALQTWDFGLFKNISVTEKTRLQFRAELFNAFNNVNFSNPNSSIGAQGAATPGFGQISSTATPQRQIQFGLKYLF